MSAIVSIGIVVLASCGVSAGPARGDVRYGAPGLLAPEAPEFCPPPLNAVDDRDWNARGDRWWRSAGGDACYGADGPYRVCGDAYRDEVGKDDPGDCAGSNPQAGLPFALSDDQRWASVDQVVGGECFDARRDHQVRLIDCGLPFDGRVVWGHAYVEEGAEGACAANTRAWNGRWTTELVVSGSFGMCLVLA